jgi:hypothetical protein
MNKLIGLIFTIVFVATGLYSFGQSNEDHAIINIYRLKESVMSGGSSLNVKVFLNEKEITNLQTNVKLSYTHFSTGNLKVKCIAEFSGSPIGSPFVSTLDIEKGKEYHISINAGSMFGVKGEIVDEKGLKKISKLEFSDTIELAEDK